MKRRDLLKSTLLIPVGMLLSRISFANTAKAAAPANALSESDAMAVPLKYKADANQAGPMRTNKEAFCYTCAKFNKCAAADKACKPEKKDAAYAPCEIFAGKTVSKDGWCLVWMKA